MTTILQCVATIVEGNLVITNKTQQTSRTFIFSDEGLVMVSYTKSYLNLSNIKSFKSFNNEVASVSINFQKMQSATKDANCKRTFKRKA